MSCPALRTDELAETYATLRLMIYKIAHRFAELYQVDPLDLISESHAIYVREFDRFDPAKGGAIGSWIYTKVTYGLMSYLRKNKRHRGHANVDDLAEVMSTQDSRFLLTLREELSDDAQSIVRLILDSAQDFSVLCRWHRVATKTKFLDVLAEHLEDAGWEPAAIKKYLREIAAVINDQAATREQVAEFWREEDPVLLRLDLTREQVKVLLRQ